MALFMKGGFVHPCSKCNGGWISIGRNLKDTDLLDNRGGGKCHNCDYIVLRRLVREDWRDQCLEVWNEANPISDKRKPIPI